MSENGGTNGVAITTGAAGRRRWPSVFAFGVACLIGAGVAFWRTPVLYRSVALIAVRATGDAMDPAARAAPAEVAAAAFASRRTLDLAVASRNWPGGRPMTPRAADELERRLSADVRPGGVIAVSFADSNAYLARARLDECVDAYVQIRSEQDQKQFALRVGQLDEERTRIDAEVNALTKEMLDQAKVYGTLDFKALLEHRLESMLRLERAIQDFKVQGLQAQANAGGAPPPKNPAVAALSARLAEERAGLADLEQRRIRTADLADRRARLARLVAEVQRRRDALSAEGASASGVTLLAPAGPASVAVDHRARNAVIGGLAGVLAWFALRWLWRTSRVRWRVASARRAFPLETSPPPPPRPVVPIDA